MACPVQLMLSCSASLVDNRAAPRNPEAKILAECDMAKVTAHLGRNTSSHYLCFQAERLLVAPPLAACLSFLLHTWLNHTPSPTVHCVTSAGATLTGAGGHLSWEVLFPLCAKQWPCPAQQLGLGPAFPTAKWLMGLLVPPT